MARVIRPAAAVIAALLGACGGTGSSWRVELPLSGPPQARPAGSVAVVLDAAGDVLAARPLGHEPGLELLKLSGESGERLWRHELDDVELRAFRLAAGGDVVLGGVLRSAETERPSAFAARFSGASGSERWRLSASEGAEGIRGLALDHHGQVLAAADPGFRVLKLARDDGHVVWQRVLSEHGRIDALTSSPDGDPLAAGRIEREDGSAELAIVRLYGLDGAERWRRTVSRAKGKVLALVVDTSGGLAAAFAQPVSKGTVLIALKLDSRTGKERWRRRLHWTEGGAALAVEIDTEGAVLLAGSDPRGLFVAKLASSDGRELWRYALPDAEGARERGGVRALARAADGSVIAAGFTADASGRQFAVLKLSDEGEEVWVRRIAGRVGEAHAVVLNESGDVIVSGYLAGEGTSVDLAVVKLRGASGEGGER